MTRGERIKKCRKEAGLTQKQLAERMNVTTSLIGQYEAGHKIPTPGALERIAAALGIPYYWLVVDPLPAQKSKKEYLSAAQNKRAEIQEAASPGDDMRAAIFSLLHEGYKILPVDFRSEAEYHIVNENEGEDSGKDDYEETPENVLKDISAITQHLNVDGLKEVHHHAELVYMIDRFRKDDTTD